MTPCVTFSLDGVALDDERGRWRLLKSTTVSSGLAVRVVDVTIPDMDGSVRVGRESLDTPVWSGRLGVYGDSVRALSAQFDGLARLFRDGSVLTRTVNGVETSTGVTCRSVSSPEFSAAGRRMSFAAEMRMPDVAWRGRAVTFVGAAVASGVPVDVATLYDSTAPVDDAVVLISGPAVNPMVSCGGSWFRLGITLASGDAALVDCAAWTVRAGAGVTFAGGGTVRTGVLTTSGGPYLLRLRPVMVAADPLFTSTRVALAFDSGSPSLSILAAPAYLT